MRLDKLDRDIELAWHRLANGIQINLLDIPKIFGDCRRAIENGEGIDSCILDAIEKYRVKKR